jgi:hypothetical protein
MVFRYAFTFLPVCGMQLSIVEFTIIPNFTEQIWAASFDPNTLITYFTGQKGTIVKFDMGTNSILNSYPLGNGPYCIAQDEQ